MEIVIKDLRLKIGTHLQIFMGNGPTQTEQTFNTTHVFRCRLLILCLINVMGAMAWMDLLSFQIYK